LFDTIRAWLAPYRWATLELALTVLLWQAATGVFLLSLVQQYLPDQLEANAAFPGYALAIYAGGRFLLQAPAGWLADRFGRRQTLTLGITVSLPSVVLMLQVQDATSFLAFSALYGAGSAAIWPSIMAFVGDTHAPSVRGRTLNMLNLSQLLGLGAGTMIGVTLTDLISYQAAFAACLGFSALALAFAYRGARGASTPGTKSAKPAETEGLSRRLLSPRVLFLAAIALLLSIGTTIQAPVVGAYTSEVLDTKLHVLGLMLLAPAAVALVIAVRFGHLADRFGRQVPLIGGLAVAALCYYALSQTTHPLLAVNLVVLAGLAYAVSVPAWGAAALDASEFGGRGLMLGVLATVQGFGGAVGQAIGGIVNAAWGPVAPFKVGAILLMLALVLTVMHLLHQRRGEAPARA
jgi:DHA1 family multidrug resistance protein-like MFS transporter